MPTTISGLWGQITDFNNLYQAFLEARKGKRNRASVMRFAANVEENIVNIQNHLIWKSWTPGAPREFVVKEPKLRLIQAPPFIDRVIHHALVRVIGPLFERKFIHDSYACRIGKGTQAAVFRAQRFMRIAKRNHGDKVYVLKADISKFFASIKHKVLLGEIKRTVSDPDVIWLWQKIIEGYGHEDGVGLPVGALTSQLGANIMLNRLDHVAKDQMGIKYYVRYMDDFIAVLPDKESALQVLESLGLEVTSLSLALNPKTAIHPWQRGLDFCGYRIWPTHILPRKRNIKRARKNFKSLARKYARRAIDQIHVRQRVCSFLAYTKHCDANRTVAAILGELRLVRCPEKAAREAFSVTAS
ncbi:reverse transcriptase/maturase family protein [Pseudomonas sp. UMAB-08]|uniref:reverse transcriptase/maturase family protein n=1 Tax=Pseudomonas sp. UMAB-08 TaxID=1365375 RepID=UPI001C578457|nr:reverse transcriptase/maturase family protein [Pseudomonas sp. UMAB-08]